ncbi:hypothetical protein [Virgibacillus doumboii]|nr:hypothetical protein [Virgibacillus doumboii]
MKQFDWPMVLFAGVSLVHEYWIFWGLPRVYYWEVKQSYENEANDKKLG